MKQDSPVSPQHIYSEPAIRGIHLYHIYALKFRFDLEKDRLDDKGLEARISYIGRPAGVEGATCMRWKRYFI